MLYSTHQAFLAQESASEILPCSASRAVLCGPSHTAHWRTPRSFLLQCFRSESHAYSFRERTSRLVREDESTRCRSAWQPMLLLFLMFSTLVAKKAKTMAMIDPATALKISFDKLMYISSTKTSLGKKNTIDDVICSLQMLWSHLTRGTLLACDRL